MKFHRMKGCTVVTKPAQILTRFHGGEKKNSSVPRRTMDLLFLHAVMAETSVKFLYWTAPPPQKKKKSHAFKIRPQHHFMFGTICKRLRGWSEKLFELKSIESFFYGKYGKESSLC